MGDVAWRSNLTHICHIYDDALIYVTYIRYDGMGDVAWRSNLTHICDSERAGTQVRGDGQGDPGRVDAQDVGVRDAPVLARSRRQRRRGGSRRKKEKKTRLARALGGQAFNKAAQERRGRWCIAWE